VPQNTFAAHSRHPPLTSGHSLRKRTTPVLPEKLLSPVELSRLRKNSFQSRFRKLCNKGMTGVPGNPLGRASRADKANQINVGLYRLRKNYQMAEVLKGHGFSRANKANQINVGLYRLRKNYQMAEVLKGHGFSRAASG
jgi:hypothetical protein